MLRLKCTKILRDLNGKVTGYRFKDQNYDEYNIKPENLLVSMENHFVEISNLKLENGQIVQKKDSPSDKPIDGSDESINNNNAYNEKVALGNETVKNIGSSIENENDYFNSLAAEAVRLGIGKEYKISTASGVSAKLLMYNSDISADKKQAILYIPDGVERLNDFNSDSPFTKELSDIIDYKYYNFKLIGGHTLKNMQNMFYEITVESVDFTDFDTSNVTIMHGLFHSCHRLKTVNFAGVDTHNVKGMSAMFADCKALNYLDLSPLNTSNVTDMSGMFMETTIGELDLSTLDVSKVQNMVRMFEDAVILNLNLSGWNTASLENAAYMFLNAKIPNINIANFNISSLNSMFGMFSHCHTDMIDMRGVRLTRKPAYSKTNKDFDKYNETNIYGMFDLLSNKTKVLIDDATIQEYYNMSNDSGRLAYNSAGDSNDEIEKLKQNTENLKNLDKNIEFLDKLAKKIFSLTEYSSDNINVAWHDYTESTGQLTRHYNVADKNFIVKYDGTVSNGVVDLRYYANDKKIGMHIRDEYNHFVFSIKEVEPTKEEIGKAIKQLVAAIKKAGKFKDR